MLIIAMLSVNYLPDKLFHEFPLEPRSVEPPNYDSFILEWNSKLTENSGLEYIQLNQIAGPESVAIDKNGLLYTGLSDGRIVELDPLKKYKMRQVLRFNMSPQCVDNNLLQISFCGRFLQMRIANNTLYALEASNGLYKINVAGSKTLLGPKKLNEINLFNGFAFDPKEPNLAYITVSSTKWGLQRIIWSIMDADNSGQLIALDIKTGKRVIVLDKLMTPNGIDVDAKRDQIIFSETTLSRISSISLKDVRTAIKTAKDGDKLTNIDRKTLISIVPGTPDNVIVHSDDVYIALPIIKQGKDLMDHLANKPSLRKAFGRFVYGAGQILEYFCNKIYHHPLLEFAYRELKSGHILYKFVNKNQSGIIKYNLATGAQKFLGSSHFSYLSEARPDGLGGLYLGSFQSPFLAKVKE